MGCKLVFFHPKVAAVSCEDCVKYAHSDWEPIFRTNPKTGKKEKVPRAQSSKPPCSRCPKIPQGVEPIPKNAVELSERNLLAFAHHERCRAVRSWPDDWIVAEKARIIESVREEYRGQIETSFMFKLQEVFRHGREA